jgi:AhpD family alkylhydroperoxidase
MTTDTRIEDWDSYSAGLRDRGKEFSALHPEAVRGFSALNRGAAQTKHLDEKMRELISLAVAVTLRCQGCIDAHARKAKAAGASREEVAEALGVAMALNAGAALTYSLHALDAMAGAGETASPA